MKPRLLFVSPRFLFPMDQGGKIRTGNILRGLKDGAFEVTLASPAPADQVPYAADIDAACDHFLSWPEQGSSRFRRLIKQKIFHQMWHDDEWIKKNVSEADEYDYSIIDSLKKFDGTHPVVMKNRLKKMNWQFFFDISKKKFKLKDWLLYQFEKVTGIRLFEYKNYREI